MNAIIVEDNPSAANVIRSFVEDSPYGLNVCSTARSVDEAVQAIRSERPSIWFLDIQLHDELVFRLFEQFDDAWLSNVSIIFITAYNNSEYLYQALAASAIDYIVKPIDPDNLYAAIEKAIEKLGAKDLPNRVRALEEAIQKLDGRMPARKIPIYRVNGVIDYTATADILYLESSNAICRFFLEGGEVAATTKSLKFYESFLSPGNGFIRISKKAIINAMRISSFNSRTNKVVLDDTGRTALSVSRRRVSVLVGYMGKL